MMQLLFFVVAIIVGAWTNIDAVRVTVTGRGGKTETIMIPYNQQVTPGTTVGGAVLSPSDTSSTVNINFGRGGGQFQQPNQQLVPAPQGLVRPMGPLPQPPIPQIPEEPLPNIQLPQIPGPLVGPGQQISNEPGTESNKLQQGALPEDLEPLEENAIIGNKIQKVLGACNQKGPRKAQPSDPEDAFPRIRHLKNRGHTGFNFSDYLGEVYKNSNAENTAIDKPLGLGPKPLENAYNIKGDDLLRRIEEICTYLGKKYGYYPEAYKLLICAVGDYLTKMQGRISYNKMFFDNACLGNNNNNNDNNNDNDNNNNNNNFPNATTTTTVHKPSVNKPNPQQQQGQQGNYPQSLLNQMPALPNDLRLLPVVEDKPYDSFPGAVDPIKRRVPRNMIPWYNILSVDRNTGNLQDVNRNYSTLRAQIDQKIKETDRKNIRMLYTLDSMINILNNAHTAGVQYFQRKK